MATTLVKCKHLEFLCGQKDQQAYFLQELDSNIQIFVLIADIGLLMKMTRPQKNLGQGKFLARGEISRGGRNSLGQEIFVWAGRFFWGEEKY